MGEFEEIVVRANPDGSIIRLRDVARVSLEASSYNTESGINGGNAAVLNINMLPGANAMEVADAVKEAMEEISRNFPEGISYQIPFDMTTYISESIHHVYQTLFEALLLVILVVFLSLQNWRATLIPIVAVPISLIGTFGVMLVFGFSLNMMTLLGLILAIGNRRGRRRSWWSRTSSASWNRNGCRPTKRPRRPWRRSAAALIAMSLVLCAVLRAGELPGRHHGAALPAVHHYDRPCRSSSPLVVALTLSPVMCAYFLRPDNGRRKPKLFRRINYWLRRGNTVYQRGIRGSLRHSRRMLAAFGILLVGIWLMNRITPQSFMPKEDQGYFTVELELPEGRRSNGRVV